MPARTAIEWADYSTNPLVAFFEGDARRGWSCAKVGPECLNCYSEAINNRFGNGRRFSRSNTEAAAHLVRDRELQKILAFRPRGPFKNGRSRPAVFPCDMTDLFGEWVRDDQLDKIVATFALRPDVDFLCLTQRAARMRAYFTDPTLGRRLYRQISRWLDAGAGDFLTSKAWDRAYDLAGASTTGGPTFDAIAWRLPLANLWLGVSGGRQDFAERRLRNLFATPAAVRFLSAEPLIGPLDFLRMTTDAVGSSFALTDGFGRMAGEGPPLLQLVIAGGESGRGARPCDVASIRQIVAQCRDAGVACFVKQLGSKPFDSGVSETDYRRQTLCLKNSKGGDPAEWPYDLRVREFPPSPAAILEAATR